MPQSIWRSGHVGYFADMALTLGIIATVLVLTAVSLLAAVIGFALWQAFEWAVHRYVLHGLARAQHWLHHKWPTGDAGIPLYVTVPLVLALLGLCVVTFGLAVGGGLFAGFSLGYLTYNFVHWAIHAGHWPRSGVIGSVARRHDLHHCGVEANFNVLLPFADMAFGTYRAA